MRPRQASVVRREEFAIRKVGERQNSRFTRQRNAAHAEFFTPLPPPDTALYVRFGLDTLP